MKVLITGSREASPDMLAKVREVVAWCTRDGYEILVGDAPGIDAKVREEAFIQGVPFTVCGAYGRYRPGLFGQRGGCDWPDYLARDRHMAQRCDLCIAIWNGRSRGTRATAAYATSLRKQVIWRVFPA